MKKIMILGASILQLPAIEKAKEMGLDVIVVDMNPEAVGFGVQGIKKEIISTIDTPAILEVAKQYQINGIMTLATDMPIMTVATVAREMGLVGVSVDTALKATNKAYMREALKKRNVPVPLSFHVETKQEYREAIESVRSAGYQCIIKPADNSGSRGIAILSDFKSATLDNIFKYSKQFSRSGVIMVEEFMEGSEVSVETLSIDGVCHVIQITDKITTGAPFFVEMGHSQPSQLSDETKEEIKRVAIAAIRAVGIENGPSHTEIIVTKDGPKIVELGARLGGDNITTHLVPLSTGLNMVECCIRIALGEQPDLNIKFNKGSAIRYFKSGIGKIHSITGIEKSKTMPGIRQINVIHDVGEQAVEIRSSVDRIGFVIAQDESSEKAVKDCEDVLKKIEIVVCQEAEDV